MRDNQHIAHRRERDGGSQQLASHLQEVGRYTAKRTRKIGLSNQGELIGLVHDLGKYSDEFQTYLQSATGLISPDEDDFVDVNGARGRIDHSTAGAQLIWRSLTPQGALQQIVGQLLALCVASHHSGMIDCLSSSPHHPAEDVFQRRMGKPERKSHYREVIGKVDPHVDERQQALLSDARLVQDLKKVFRGVMETNAVNGVDPPANTIVQFKLGLLARFLFSCLIDADRVDTADFEKPRQGAQRPGGQYVAWETLVRRLENHLDTHFERESDIDKARDRVSQACRVAGERDRGTYTLTVPTGGGKTLASLRFALHHAKTHKMDRIVYVVPFTTIIDQNAGRVREILEKESERGQVVLEHHSNLTPEREDWRTRMLAENWDIPVVFTTSVQLLEALFGGGTRGPRRMHQLANAVIVFDEIQALPVKCVHLFCNAINFLVDECGSSVLLCSATQPLLNRVDAAKGALRYGKEDELVPDVGSLFRDMRRVEIIDRRKAGGWGYNEIANLATGEAAAVGSCLVVANTKVGAREVYLCAKASHSLPVYHLSASMCPAHRRTVLKCVARRLRRRLPVLCVSTQVIEAGVDIDFGCVVRFVAGLDSIAQAAGRCNRNA